MMLEYYIAWFVAQRADIVYSTYFFASNKIRYAAQSNFCVATF